jgi:ABC-2 type transport system ATP-binding protein
MSEHMLIRANNLSRYYGGHCAVDDISFELRAGDILGFLGPNGAGKSTTMQMLSGNLAPNAGEIAIDGIDLFDRPGAAKAALGYLPETPPLYKEMSVDEYLVYCAKLHRLNKSERKDAVELAKTRCGLTTSGKRLIGNLSKGFQQRVGIAQAIVHSPRVIILDEPTVGLDPIQIREIRELMVELGKTHGIILSTHILPEIEAVCNRVQIIHEGRLVYSAGLDELLRKQLSGQYELTLASPPPMNDLGAMKGFEHVEALGDNDFIVHTDIGAQALARRAVENGWGLSRLTPHERTLEQIFVDLTLGDKTGGAVHEDERA